ncbi:cytochrome c oxidase assembly protein [Alicyclobacillus sp. ALC3]|uniref:cytochrome c oxidase assembly protein n=1 Tax=Alicyclobacillus sp. ALC3 TaxID=2796143 RepID=UPI00237878E2|nr:cytochrome c oxidase assembly protein [Alicyclobacillus sp. ALC3]WDL96120.1 cytochrome c oxidase assembly protein [Alicyclobacillus sp. ALC3]
MGNFLQGYSWPILWRPDVLIALALAGVVYCGLVGPLRHRFPHASRATVWQVSAAGTLLILLYLAMGTPLNLIAERFSFTAYVIKMLVITQIAAPLLLLALPPWLLETVVTVPFLRRVFKFACNPITGIVSYSALSTLFLLPSILRTALSNDLIHILVQYTLMLSAVFLWWPLLSRVPSLPRLTPGAQLIYLLFAMNFMMPITVFLFFSPDPWYSFYVRDSVATSATADQQVGALVMVGGMWVVYGLRALRPFLSHTEATWYE